MQVSEGDIFSMLLNLYRKTTPGTNCLLFTHVITIGTKYIPYTQVVIIYSFHCNLTISRPGSVVVVVSLAPPYDVCIPPPYHSSICPSPAVGTGSTHRHKKSAN